MSLFAVDQNFCNRKFGNKDIYSNIRKVATLKNLSGIYIINTLRALQIRKISLNNNKWQF